MTSIAAAVEAIKTGAIDALQKLVAADSELCHARDENGSELGDARLLLSPPGGS